MAIREFKKFYLVLIGVLLAALALHLLLFSAPRRLAENSLGVDLSGGWEMCITASVVQDDFNNISEISRDCIWKEYKPPNVIRFDGRPLLGARIILRKYFETPTNCADRFGKCSLFVGTVTDPAVVFVNGQILGDHSDPFGERHFALTFPLVVSIPFVSFNRSAVNELSIVLLPGNAPQSHGIIASPIKILSTERQKKVWNAFVAHIVLLPMGSAILLSALLILAFVVALGAKKLRHPMVKVFLLFLVFAFLHLVGLTRFPRSYLPEVFDELIHWAIRSFYDAFQLKFVILMFYSKSHILRIINGYQFGIALAYFLLSVLSLFDFNYRLMWINQGIFALYRVGFVFSVLPSVIVIFLVASKYARVTRYHVMFAVSVFAAPMMFSDYLSLIGVYESYYFSRFLPVPIAFSYAYALWREFDRERSIAEVNARLGMIVSQVAHDIRSPVAALKSLLRNDSLTIESVNGRSILSQAIVRIDSIAADLLRNHAMSGREKSNLRALAVKASSLVDEKKVIWRDRKKITFNLKNFDSSRLTALCVDLSEFTLLRVLSNLLDNSIQAVSVGGEITIEFDLVKSQFICRVYDNGKGIPSELLPKVMSAGESHGKSSGIGLGLAYCRGQIEGAGGSVLLRSEVGVGTVVEMQLPMSPCQK